MATNLLKDHPRELHHFRFIELDESWLSAVCALETQCYPNPWSAPVISGEFQKDISFRPALVADDELIAYSFNYIVIDEAHILNLAVHPAYREQGIGRLLLARVLSEMIRRGVCYVALEVRRSNRVAQHLYAKNGFRIAGVRKSYYRSNGEDALLMERPLRPEDLSVFQEMLMQ